jgi:integrase
VEIDEKIKEVNTALSEVSIRRKGNRLYLRATLPPKPGDGDSPRQYELSTKCNATAEGLKLSKAKAQELESLLIREKFSWLPYLKGKDKPPETVGEWVARFEAAHWEKTPRTPTKENSYHKDYRLKFLKLPEREPLRGELLKETILKLTKPSTRSRKGFCMAYRLLAEFAGISIDLKSLGNGYSQKSVQPRDLPSDTEIQEARNRIKNPAWRWVFDVLAIYGIRPHEIFRISLDRLNDEPPILEVEEHTKTGQRIVYPCRADFWTDFDPMAVQYPNIRVEGRNNNDLGEKISQEFLELKIGFPPYALRHSYSRRCFEYGFPPDFTAKSMGHSLAVHMKQYRAWIGEQAYTNVYKTVMQNRTNQLSADLEESS